MSEDLPAATTSAASTRLMNALAMLVLSGAVFAVFFAATPALVRAALKNEKGVGVARGAGRHLPRRAKLPGAPHPGFDALNDDSERDDGDGTTGNIDTPPGLPRQPWLGPDPGSLPRSHPTSSAPERPHDIRIGLARQALKLRDGPRDIGLVIGEIKAGEQVVILRESAGWALVVHSGVMGWTRKSEIAVR